MPLLVEASKMLDKALEGHYAIGHFNINNLEWTKSILLECEELKTPVILGVSEGANKYMGGFNTVVGMVTGLVKDLNITVPVALHLDHGTFEGAKAAIEAGFSSVMFDGSHLSMEENLEKTREIVKIAHAKGVSVEAEVGSIGGEEDGVIGRGEIADPKDAKALVDTGIDFLAAGIGNIHGVYPENWESLDFEALKALHDAIGQVPMVLHGGTGIPNEQVKKAIQLGISKVNVNTELQIAWSEEVRKYIEEGKDKVGKGFDPRKVLAEPSKALRRMVREKVEIFGSQNEA